MNTLEQDAIGHEEASRNNIDVEKGEVLVPVAGQSFYAELRLSLFFSNMYSCKTVAQACLYWQTRINMQFRRYGIDRKPRHRIQKCLSSPWSGLPRPLSCHMVVLAMAIGIILGDFGPTTGPALQKRSERSNRYGILHSIAYSSFSCPY